MEHRDVCIVHPNRNEYSETFIRAHIERLPATVKVLYGGYLPSFADDGSAITASTFGAQLRASMMRRALGMSWDSYQRHKIGNLLRSYGTEVVMAEYGPTGVEMMEICESSGIPLVVHFHGYDAYVKDVLEGPGRRYPELFQKAAAIIAVSHDMERQLVELGAPKEKIHWNPCGVDTRLFHGADPAGASPAFLAVGRFVDKKAPQLTILAFRQVLDSVPAARLIMIGDGPLWEACQQLAKGLGIERAIEFRGPQPHESVAQAMRGVRGFVQHSIRTSCGDSEGTPVAVLEAVASGLPVVATRHAGIQDVVIHGVTGLLMDEGDVGEMATQMTLLATNPQLAGKYGKAGCSRVVEGFSIQKSIEHLWAIIEACAS